MTIKERVDELFKDLCEAAYEGPSREEITKAIIGAIEEAEKAHPPQVCPAVKAITARINDYCKSCKAILHNCFEESEY